LSPKCPEEKFMLEWLAEKIIAIVSSVPVLLEYDDPIRFGLVRGMFALLFVVVVLLIIAWRPFRFFRKKPKA
jgi:hypothetical protein